METLTDTMSHAVLATVRQLDGESARYEWEAAHPATQARFHGRTDSIDEAKAASERIITGAASKED